MKRVVTLLFLLAATALAMDPPKLLDPALKLEALCAAPNIEAPTTVVGAPDGSFYVGCDPRDARLNTDKPECYIVRYSSMGAEKKRTVFADKIFSPAGSAWHDGWLYIAHDPFLTRFRDTDGDGIADVREDLITHLGKQPDNGLNDHLASGFTLGMDGFFYISIGDRGTFQTKSVKDGSTISLQGGGIIRFRPDGTALEIFSTGTRNHLAVCLDAEDNAFTLDNTDDGNGWWTRLTHHIEGGYYGYPYDYQHAPNFGVTQPSKETLDAVKRRGGNDQGPMTNDQLAERAATSSDIGHWSLVTGHFPFLPAMTDFGPGSPTGGLCYLSDGLPESYRGKLLFSEWGKGGLFVIEVARDGATFRFVKNTPLIQGGNGIDFRPMQLSVAADGSLLIADWQWGGWKGPKTVGAVWRLSWPEAKPAPRVQDESKATVEELITALGHPDRDQRLRAQGELVKRGTVEMNGIISWEYAKAPEKTELLRTLGILARDESVALIKCHALWALENIGGRGADKWIDNYRGQPGHLASLPGLDLAYRGIYPLLPVTSAGNESNTGSSDPMVRSQAMRALGVSRWKYDCEVIEEAAGNMTKSADPVERREAAQAVGNANFSNSPSRLVALLADSDRSVRFTARFALQNMIERVGLGIWDLDTKEFAKPALDDNEWLVFSRLQFSEPIQPSRGLLNEPGEAKKDVLEFLTKRADARSKATDRARTVEVLGTFAYQPKPWDGHWWGTQPVKNPPPLPGVAWEGTARAIEALTAALADADSGVRLAAAQAFANFLLDDSGKPAAAALRARLTAETDPAIRRQLIESLGVQKDPQAMEVFRQIALGDPDMNFRETAIAAVVNIGGDDARKTIAQLASAQLSPAATRKIIQAAGELKVLEAAPALLAHLSDEDAGNRESAIKSLAQLGPKSGALDGLLATLLDRDAKVQTAAVEALGNFKDQRALPALLDFSKTKRARRETINAIAALMPDTQALPFLVDALREKGTGERRSALTALKKMRAEAWPMIEENLASGTIPAEFAPEIRMAFDSGVIARWKMVGPFENVWEAVHPPETEMLRGLPLQRQAGQAEGPPRDPLAAGAASHVAESLALRYTNAEGKEVGWTDVPADHEGRVDLGKVFKTSGMVCAYAFTEIESPEDADAKLLCGSDDQIAVWLNGKKLHDSGAGSRSLNVDQDEVPVHFTKGRNALLVKIGNVGGGWEFAARIPGVDGGKFVPNKEPAPDVKQRAFSLATKPDGTWQNPGDAKRGEKLFSDPTASLGGLCATCHKVRGLGKEIGPDLSLVGSIYKRADLVVSILEPSKTIALGFEQNMIETNGGETFTGALRQETADAFTLVGVDGQPHIVKKTDVKTRKPMESSLMPPGLTLGLKPEDFADLLAFLETLK